MKKEIHRISIDNNNINIITIENDNDNWRSREQETQEIWKIIVENIRKPEIQKYMKSIILYIENEKEKFRDKELNSVGQIQRK